MHVTGTSTVQCACSRSAGRRGARPAHIELSRGTLVTLEVLAGGTSRRVLVLGTYVQYEYSYAYVRRQEIRAPAEVGRYPRYLLCVPTYYLAPEPRVPVTTWPCSPRPERMVTGGGRGREARVGGLSK